VKKIINTDKAPGAIATYSQAVKIDKLIFTAGQIAISPATGDLIKGEVAVQTTQVLENLKIVIQAAGGDLSSVVKTTVYLTNPDDFLPMNKAYAQYFPNEPPARTTVFISALPKGALVEIDAVAQL
jgi:2-iminobutanoate/2-iminopropanoate deaminase